MSNLLRNYRATFILDNRGKEDTAEAIVENLKKEISAVKGEVTGVENLGKKDFVRVTDRRFTGSTYLQVSFSAPPAAPAQLKERLRLQHNIYRTFIESIKHTS
jgi:small subunit ribosomal protein S6